MAANKFRYQHLRTNSGATPTASILKDGELAVGYQKDNEKLFIKNTQDEIIEFIPENKIDEKLTGITGSIETISGDVEDLKAEKFGGVFYDSTNKVINFYDNSTDQNILGTVDATDFIKDGMVDNVEIKTMPDPQDTGSTITVLAITFNTDAGKEEIDIPLTDFFDASNYYTKAETDALLNNKTDVSAFTAHTADTVAHVTQAEKDAWDAKQDALTAGDGIDITNNVISVAADQTIIEDSTNAVAGGAVYDGLAAKQDTLVSGTNIKTLTKTQYDLLGSGTQNLYIVDLSDVTVDPNNNDVIFDAGSF